MKKNVNKVKFNSGYIGTQIHFTIAKGDKSLVLDYEDLVDLFQFAMDMLSPKGFEDKDYIRSWIKGLRLDKPFKRIGVEI